MHPIWSTAGEIISFTITSPSILFAFCFLLTVQVLDMGDDKEKFSLEIYLFICFLFWYIVGFGLTPQQVSLRKLSI